MPVFMLIWEELLVEGMILNLLHIHSSSFIKAGYPGKVIRYIHLFILYSHQVLPPLWNKCFNNYFLFQIICCFTIPRKHLLSFSNFVLPRKRLLPFSNFVLPRKRLLPFSNFVLPLTITIFCSRDKVLITYTPKKRLIQDVFGEFIYLELGIFIILLQHHITTPISEWWVLHVVIEFFYIFCFNLILPSF